MARCEELLCDTDLSLSEISERFGFCDQFYFSRRFKAKYGETPRDTRKMKPNKEWSQLGKAKAERSGPVSLCEQRE